MHLRFNTQRNSRLRGFASYFMGSMREDRNRSLFLHFPHISLPHTKLLSRCTTIPISNQKSFRGESLDSEFWGMMAKKCFYIYWYYARRWGWTTDFETGRLYMSLRTVGCFHFCDMTSTRVTGLYHMIVDNVSCLRHSGHNLKRGKVCGSRNFCSSRPENPGVFIITQSLSYCLSTRGSLFNAGPDCVPACAYCDRKIQFQESCRRLWPQLTL